MINQNQLWMISGKRSARTGGIVTSQCLWNRGLKEEERRVMEKVGEENIEVGSRVSRARICGLFWSSVENLRGGLIRGVLASGLYF